VVQSVESIPQPGWFIPYSMAMHRDYLYVSSTFACSYFKRDAQTGKLTYVDGVFNGRSKRGKLIAGGYTITFAGGRMYRVSDDGKGITWCDIDEKTGKPVEKGNVECPPSWHMGVSPDEKHLYVKTCKTGEEKLLWFTLEADGKPVKAGEVSGKGLGANAFRLLPSMFQRSPDGKYFYSISSADYAIACIARKSDGSIAYRDTTDLEKIFKRDPVRDPYRWATLALSPDGKWLYAAVQNGSPRTNFYAIFKRDAETGVLTHQETVSGDQNPMANLRGWTLTFCPGGETGFLACVTGPLLTLTYDSKTGRLSDPGMVAGTKAHGFGSFLWDAAGKFLYAGSCNELLYGNGIFVLKTN
jgi:6-phosphogluconolactonase (cycloisomerase 2 family)